MRWWLVLAVGCVGTTGKDDEDSGSRGAPNSSGDDDDVPTGDDDDGVTPTPTGDDDTEPEPSAFADCVSVGVYASGPVVTAYYDADGYLEQSDVDQEGDGTVDATTTYTWELDGGVVSEFSWSGTGGDGTTWCDEHGHPESSTSTTSAGTTDTIWVNTHDGDLLSHATMTSSGSDSVSDIDYGACEWWTDQSTDVYGDGSLIVEAHAAWVDRGGCVPERVVTTDGDGNVLSTLLYDEHGRLVEMYGDGWSIEYTWTCPG